MAKWLSKNDRHTRHTQGIGFTLASSPSLSLASLPTPIQFLFISWQSPLCPLGPARPPTSPLPTSLPAGKAAESAAGDPIVVGEAAGLFAPEPAEKAQQSMASDTAGSSSIDRPSSQGWQLGAGGQVEGSWGRLGIQPYPASELQASVGLPTWGLGLRGTEG